MLSPLTSSLHPLDPASADEDAAQPLPPIHAAVISGDHEAVAQLRREGRRINELDQHRRSPLDVLDAMRGIDDRARSMMRMALLESLNPTAPRGYMKPEALHGTPWGMEVLQSKALMGGVNDKKGGSQSLEGQVFFSDRTTESDGDKTTRKDFRVKPRIYAVGSGRSASNAFSRAAQHRLTQVMLNTLNNGKPLQTTASACTIDVTDLRHIGNQERATWLQVFLHDSYIMKVGGKPLINTPLDQHVSTLKLPATITLRSGERTKILKDGELASFYHHAASALQHELENGKAPYLGLLNQGSIVRVIFGFEKINNLSSHEIRSPLKNKVQKYSYQPHSHPLSGSASGGKLKEIEVHDLEDLATLCLGCAVKGIALPRDVVIRIKGHKKVQAEYLDLQQFGRFQDAVLKHAAHLSGGQKLSDQSLEHLQTINADIRSSNLKSFL